MELLDPIPQETVQETTQIVCECNVDFVPLISTIELGFSSTVVFLGVVCGLILSKIANWWKW